MDSEKFYKNLGGVMIFLVIAIYATVRTIIASNERKEFLGRFHEVVIEDSLNNSMVETHEFYQFGISDKGMFMTLDNDSNYWITQTVRLDGKFVPIYDIINLNDWLIKKSNCDTIFVYDPDKTRLKNFLILETGER